MDKVEVSDYESLEDRYYYSLYTMRHFREIYGEDTCMIIGGDSLLSLHLWYGYEQFIKENKLIVFTRDDDRPVTEAVETYRRDGACIFEASMPPIDVSSTEVRKFLTNGKIKDGTLSSEVIEYIKQEKLYGGNL